MILSWQLHAICRVIDSHATHVSDSHSNLPVVHTELTCPVLLLHELLHAEHHQESCKDYSCRTVGAGNAAYNDDALHVGSECMPLLDAVWPVLRT
jgi:hypothetical protein